MGHAEELFATIAGLAAAWERGDTAQVEIGRQLFSGNPEFVIGAFSVISYLAGQLGAVQEEPQSGTEVLQILALGASASDMENPD